ncbi:MAG: AmmeMemoRadiSam system protein A [Planctomycetota bacterium]|jgi:AmmeMemoRadiSam system protein A|nr:AmmeMemoRadiSam system protein A [Planctomycetota bacterium]
MPDLPTIPLPDRLDLLRRARIVLEREIVGNPTPDLPEPSPTLQHLWGAFVTLRERSSNELRGCIGRMTSDLPLWATVEKLVLQSAREDPRFEPVNPKEVDKLRIDVSILSALLPIDSPNEMIIGLHGIQIENGGHRAVFLPQVPLDMGWNREETLRQACRKAEIDETAIHAPDTRFWIFRSISFSEPKSLS